MGRVHDKLADPLPLVIGHEAEKTADTGDQIDQLDLSFSSPALLGNV